MSETKSPALQYRFDGPEDAPVLILGPSLGTTWHMWDRQVPELVKQWRVFRFDLPGHGGAPAYPAGSVTELADRLLATLDGVRRPALRLRGLLARRRRRIRAGAAPPGAARLAHADRGLTPLRHGRRVPPARRDRTDERPGPDRADLARSAGSPQGFAAAQPAITEWAVQMVRTTDPGCYIAACEALASFDIQADLGRIGVPTLVLVGSDDQVTGPAEARTLVAGIPDARLAVVPGASHLVPVEQPAAVTDLLVRHFSTAWQQPAYDSATGQMAIPVPQVQPVLTAAPPQRRPSPRSPRPPPSPRQSGADPTRTTRASRSAGRCSATRTWTGRWPQADEFSGDFQEFITRYAWGEIWDRPGLDRRSRSCVTLTALVAGGHLDELAFHTRAALRNGLTPSEIKEVLLQAAVYCGVPAANSAFKVAQQVIREETTPTE